MTATTPAYGHIGRSYARHAAPTAASRHGSSPRSVTPRRWSTSARAAAEYGAEFRSDVAAFVDRAIVEAAIMTGVQGVPPDRDRHHVGFCDPAGG